MKHRALIPFGPIVFGLISAGGIVLCSGLIGCGGSDEPTNDPVENPLSFESSPGLGLLPWPSSHYLIEDSHSVTGYRVNYPADVLPKTDRQQAIDPSRYNRADGFSIGSQPLVYFPEGVSVEGLPNIDDIASSENPSALVQILNFTTGRRVPLFAEIDANDDPAKALLIIRPQVPLDFNTRYVVVLRQGLKRADGGPLSAPAQFSSMLAAIAEHGGTTTFRRRMKEVIDFLASQEMPSSQLVLAWDFHTASQEYAQSRLLHVVNDGLARLPDAGPEYTITASSTPSMVEDAHTLRRISGTLRVPTYLDIEDTSSTSELDAEGLPIYTADVDYDFSVAIPRCAATHAGPLPILLYGHGLFGSAEHDLGLSFHGLLRERLCVVEVGVDWRGLAKQDLSGVLINVVPDFGKLHWVTDRLRQGHLNFHSFVRLLKGQLMNDPALQLNGGPAGDVNDIHYLGISNGGIQGGIFASLNEDIRTYALHVTGGWWSMILQRSSHFLQFSKLLDVSYSKPRDLLILIHLSQSIWDDADPLVFAKHPLQTPLPGHTTKQLLFQEGIDDDRLANIATRAIARAYGLPLLSPHVEEVYGVETALGPLPSAYAQWDTQPSVKSPKTNKQPQGLKVSDTPHVVLRWQERCVEQLKQFFLQSQVVHTCGNDPCVGDQRMPGFDETM